MITLYPNEKIIRVVHRHWVVIAEKMTIIVILLLIPVGGMLFLFGLTSISPAIASFSLYLVSLYSLIIAIVAFSMWMDYYLDIWVITTRRIIDVEHKGIFHREVSEFMLERIQDITINKPNFLALMLAYGNISIHTAGERSFTAYSLPNIKEIKDLIINQKMLHH